ncbi:hypothetical protein [uncultured Draconibacterium sp.]|uniref:hypothetical protein n=1 Tax=uncultured Draconibacterium sp. TaxID=1573823 RepID=UPI00325FF3AD
MRKDPEKLGLYVFFFLLIVFQLVLIFLNEKTFGGADSISHYHIAKYAFKYPHLFLDLWGKPVYTTLLSFFALGGFKLAQIFNLIVAVFSLYVVYIIARQYFPKSAFSITVLAAFAPIYFVLTTSCLTEVLFGLVLIISVYLFLAKKYLFSAIVLSFIPFVRSEGIVFLPVFAAALVLSRSYRSVLFLLTGTLFYSLVGFLAFGDVLWIINRFPYPTGESVYGNGSLFHFIKKSDTIFGIPMLTLILIGLVVETTDVLKKFSLTSPKTIRYILVVGSWLTYFAAHSYVWWQGRGGSLGLIRVIGGVLPLAALSAAAGLEFILDKTKGKRAILVIAGFVMASQLLLFLFKSDLPVKAPETDKLIEKSARFLEENQLNGKIYYFNPMIVFHLDLDPYDKTKSNWGIGDKLKPSNSMDYGDIIVWDAHFGPNEGRTSLATLKNDASLQLVKTLLPVQKITVLGGHDYGVYIFQKVKNRVVSGSSETIVRDLGIAESDAPQILKYNGENALEMSPATEYSPNIIVAMNELPSGEIIDVELSIEFMGDAEIFEKEVLLIISVENERENLRYEKLSLLWGKDDSDWKKATVNTRFSADIPQSSIIKMYIWNKDRKKLFVKSLNAEVKAH